MSTELDETIYRLNKNVYNGSEAESIVANKLYQEAWEIMDKSLFDAFMAVDPRDKEGLQIVRLSISLTKQIRNHFEQLVITGQGSALDLNALSNFKPAENEIN